MLLAGRKKVAIVAALMAMIPAFGRLARAQSNPYSLIDNWESEEIVGAEAVAIDSHGNVYAAQRCQANWSNTCASSLRPPIIKFDPSGKVIKTMGTKMFVFIHGLYVDKDDNLWATDAKGVNGKGEQVFKFSPDGQVLMTLGKAGVAGDGPDTFHGPNSVVVAPNGDIFVADGHGGDTNARIVKFSKDGTFIKAWGKKGTGPGEFGMFHALAMDSQGRLFVGDRGNGRIQIFDQDGKLLDIWEQFGSPSGIYIDASDNIYVSSGPGGDVAPPSSGVSWGIRVGSAKDGKVKYVIPPTGGVQSAGLVADTAGNIYVADVKTWRVDKYVKK
jgi:hypothetical protein